MPEKSYVIRHEAKAVVVRSLPDQGAAKNQIHSDSADILPEKEPEPMSHNSRQLSVQIVDEHPSENHARYCLTISQCSLGFENQPLPFLKSIYRFHLFLKPSEPKPRDLAILHKARCIRSIGCPCDGSVSSRSSVASQRSSIVLVLNLQVMTFGISESPKVGSLLFWARV